MAECPRCGAEGDPNGSDVCDECWYRDLGGPPPEPDPRKIADAFDRPGIPAAVRNTAINWARKRNFKLKRGGGDG